MSSPIIMKVLEECAELQKSLCKAERFGWNTRYQGVSNKEAILEEIGDVKEAIYALEKAYFE